MAIVTTPSAEPVEVVLALGANLGDREVALRGAVRMLDASEAVVVQRVSDVVQTGAVGGPEQQDYLNAVVVAATTLAPRELLALADAIEQAHGRVRTQRWGPRTLDVDVIAYGRPGSADEVVSDDPVLTLPHPRAHERAFVLAPWAQVQPDARLRLPDGSVRPVAELLSAAPDLAGVRPTTGGPLL